LIVVIWGSYSKKMKFLHPHHTPCAVQNIISRVWKHGLYVGIFENSKNHILNRLYCWRQKGSELARWITLFIRTRSYNVIFCYAWIHLITMSSTLLSRAWNSKIVNLPTKFTHRPEWKLKSRSVQIPLEIGHRCSLHLVQGLEVGTIMIFSVSVRFG